jgi:hypothetical protein
VRHDLIAVVDNGTLGGDEIVREGKLLLDRFGGALAPAGGKDEREALAESACESSAGSRGDGAVGAKEGAVDVEGEKAVGQEPILGIATVPRHGD